jgi:hypothetical protein
MGHIHDFDAHYDKTSQTATVLACFITVLFICICSKQGGSLSCIRPSYLFGIHSGGSRHSLVFGALIHC